MKKIKTTLLVGAGAVSGLVMAAAVPAGAAASPNPQPRGLCTGTPYEFSGTVTNGPDAGQPDQALFRQLPPLSGQLCVGDNHGNRGAAAPVTGIVGFDAQAQPAAATAASAALGRSPGIPVKGVAVGNSIRFDGQTTVDLAVATRAASTSAVVAAPTRERLFIARHRRASDGGATRRRDARRWAVQRVVCRATGRRLWPVERFAGVHLRQVAVTCRTTTNCSRPVRALVPGLVAPPDPCGRFRFPRLSREHVRAAPH